MIAAVRVGVDLDRLIEVADGAVVVAHVAIGEAAVVEGERVVRRDLEHQIEVRHRAVGLALGAIGHGAIVDRQRAASD